jgi:hypothetical protein
MVTDTRPVAEPSPEPQPRMLAYSGADVVAGIRECESVMRRALGKQLALVAEAEHRGLHAEAGARSMPVWLRELPNLADEDAKTRVVVGRDGMTVLKGRWDRNTEAKPRAALEPLAAPRPEHDGEKDPRSHGKRHTDAFTDLLDVVLSTDQLPRAGGQRPHIAVTIDFDALKGRLPFDPPSQGGTLETTGQPITTTQVRRLACDVHILPIVLETDGQPLDVESCAARTGT